MFVLRLNRLRVFDNRTRKSFLGLLGEDGAELKIVSFVATEQTLLPDFDRFIEETDANARREILAEAMAATLSRRVFTTIPNVRDGHVLTFGESGFAVHQGTFIPSVLDWTMMVIKSNDATRRFGVLLDDLLGDENYPSFESNLLKVLKGAGAAANPGPMAAAAIMRFIGESAAGALKRKEEELIGLYYNSLNRLEHYPHGERKYDGSPGVTGNISVDYSLFGVSTHVPRAVVVEEEAPAGELVTAAGASVVETSVAVTLPVPFKPVSALMRRRQRAGCLAGQSFYRFAGEDAFFFEAGMSIDADGSPRAYHPQSGKGLDALGNAGRPGKWWGIVTRNGKMSGAPVVQGAGDPAEGFYVSTTALVDRSKERTDPARYVDSETIPYVVLPGKHGTDARKGDLGVVVNLKNQRSVGVIFADIGPRHHLGEASMAAAKAVGINDCPRRGGQRDGVFYLTFPGSGGGKPLSAAKIKRKTTRLFEQWGGMDAVRQATGARLAQPMLIEPGLRVTSGGLAAIVDGNHTLSLDELKSDRPLAREIQQLLAAQGFVDPPVDGIWGRVSTCGWNAFCKLRSLDKEATLDRNKARTLLGTKGKQLVPLDLNTGDSFAARICRYMIAKGMWFARAKGMVNIVYLEGVNRDGTLNRNRPNRFNDLRLVMDLRPNGCPRILGSWEATTEPGKHFTEVNSLKPMGAARISLGQYRAWQVGMHRNDHEALRQVRHITVHRDGNRDYLRLGDVTETGQFYINQHWGYNNSMGDIGRASAGCLVGRTKSGHKQFMEKVKRDIRYKANSRYVFYTAVLDGREVLQGT